MTLNKLNDDYTFGQVYHNGKKTDYTSVKQFRYVFWNVRLCNPCFETIF